MGVQPASGGAMATMAEEEVAAETLSEGCCSGDGAGAGAEGDVDGTCAGAGASGDGDAAGRGGGGEIREVGGGKDAWGDGAGGGNEAGITAVMTHRCRPEPSSERASWR